MLVKVLSGFALMVICSSGWSAALQDNGDGTVYDFDTGLTWQQEDDGVIKTWAAAQNYCSSLSLGGKTDWRLPNAKDLNSITDERVYGAAFDDAMFPSTKGVQFPYWSASSYASDGTRAWYVRFDRGYVVAIGKGSAFYVRCVR